MLFWAGVLLKIDVTTKGLIEQILFSFLFFLSKKQSHNQIPAIREEEQSFLQEYYLLIPN